MDSLRFYVISIKALVLSCLLYGCASKETKQVENVKPKNVPDSSFWVGGVDGGNWYYLKYINNHRNMARIAVYNDQNGDLITDTKFMLVCESARYTFISDLKKQISSFDGDKIYFVQSDSVNCYLQPIK